MKIANELEYNAAMQRISQLIDVVDEFDSLVDLIMDYEQRMMDWGDDV